MRPSRATLTLAACGVGLTVLTLAMPWLHPRLGGSVLIAAFALHAGAIAIAWRTSDHVATRHALWIILASAMAMRLLLVPTEPTLSSDIYRYIWDGRVQAAGINPYRHVPAALELAHLRDTAIYPHINRADYAPTIYPPAAQAFFLAVTRAGETVATMKLALVACEVVVALMLLGLLRRLGQPVARIAAFAWHPLALWEIAGNGHVDALMVAGVMAALMLVFSARPLLAGLVTTLAALVKPTALLLLPVIWRPWDWRLPAVVAATLVVAYLPFMAEGAKVLGFLPGYVQEEGLTTGDGYKLLWLLQAVTGPLPHAASLYLAIAAGLMIALAAAAAWRTDRSERGSIEALVWLLTAFLVAISPHYPWYFLVLVPFLALAPTATGWVLTIGSVLFYDVIANDMLPAYEIRIAVFTIAVLGALAVDLGLRRATFPSVRFGVST